MGEAISVIVIGLTGLMILGRISRANPTGLVQRAFNKTKQVDAIIASVKQKSAALVAGAPEDEIKQFPNTGGALDSLTGGGGASGGGPTPAPSGGGGGSSISPQTSSGLTPVSPVSNFTPNISPQTSSGLTPY